MPIIDLHEKPFSPETIAKLEIFESYFEAWLPVFIHTKYFNEIIVCDFFAGTGYDLNENEGSPIRILNNINKYKKSIIKSSTKVHIIFNEFDRSKLDELKSQVDEITSEIDIGNLLTIKYFSTDFKELFEDIQSDLIKKPNLLFIDQNGIKQVTEEVFRSLIEFNCSDFLFFISSSYFKRFSSEDCFQKYFPDLNPVDISKIAQSNIHTFVLNYYKEKIPEGNQTKIYPFTIKKEGNIYGLVFGSKHPLGVDKFLNIAWRANKINGSANFDIDGDIPDAQLNIWGESKLTKIQKFTQELKLFLKTKDRTTNKEIYDYTCEQGFTAKHATDLVRKWKNDGFLIFEGQPCINYSNCYKNNNLKIIKIASKYYGN
ncbi:three-Cys-motif partner protein TcmP [Candidatus Peregrinibacteria bacterium]|nr:three-Cys-motif partner protein TcmP [Candidatus Peregrinibacteria bacterium]